jgi:hypothetical protein
MDLEAISTHQILFTELLSNPPLFIVRPNITDLIMGLLYNEEVYL